MKDKQKRRLCCLGGGKMGEALIQGFVRAGIWHAGQITVVDPDRGRRDLFGQKYGIQAEETPSEADFYVLGMKPQDMADALVSLKTALPEEAVIVSIAAGISVEWIQSRLGGKRKIVRTMPNAPALVQAGAAGLYFNDEVKEDERAFVLEMFRAVGVAVVVEDEDFLDVITGLSGSGPGYVYLLLESFTDAGVSLGLTEQMASELAFQTFLGSALMAKETGHHFSKLREMISSPGGTTLAGLRALEHGELHKLVRSAVEAATKRAGELRK